MPPVRAIDQFLRRIVFECLNLGDQLVLPLRGAPPTADDAAIAARRRINATLEQLLSDARADGTVRVESTHRANVARSRVVRGV